MEFMELKGKPLKGNDLERLKEFLKKNDLDYDRGVEYSVCLLDENYRILAAGSAEESSSWRPWAQAAKSSWIIPFMMP